MFEKSTFKQVPVGGTFRLDRGVETGLSITGGTWGDKVYVKTSARGYRLAGGETPLSIGRISCTVWVEGRR